MKFSGLRARLLTLVLLAVVPAFALIIYSDIQHRHLLREHVRHDTHRLAIMASYQQDELIAANRKFLVELARAPELRVSGSPEACNRFLAQILKRHADYANLLVFRSNGDRFCSAVPPPLQLPGNAADRKYFRDALATKDFAVGSYQIGRVTGKAVLIFAYPVLDAAGKVEAVLALAEDLRWLSRMLAIGRLPEHSVLNMVDSGGTILARYPRGGAWVGKPALRGNAAFNKVVANGGEASIDVVSLDGERRIFSYVPISAYLQNIYVGIGIPESVVREDEDRALVRNLILMSIAASIVIALAWFGSDVLVLRRLRALAQAATSLAAGNLQARAGLREDAGELGQLGHAFDAMAQSLEHRMREIERVDRALKTLSTGNRTLLRATEENALLHDMCRIVVEKGGHRMAWVGYAEHDPQKTVRPVAHAGIGGDFLDDLSVTWSETEFGLGPTGTAIRTRKPAVSTGIDSDPRLVPWRGKAIEYGFASILALPLKINGDVIGNLTIYAAESDAFGEAEVVLFEELADDLAFGIGTLRLRAEHARATAAIEHAAYHDALTDLPNRTWLRRRLEQLIADAQQQRSSVALLIIDIERFRDINEALGHHQGDAVLQLIGARLGGLAADAGALARLGADEFAVLLPATDAEAAARFSDSVLGALAQPFELSGFSVELQASVGIALYPGHGANTGLLMARADAAGRAARKTGAGYSFPPQDSEPGTVRRLALTRDLRRAIETDQLVLYCQPKIQLASGALCGGEMLARWTHPELGAISPGEFIAIAERTGLIRPLTYWVVKEAARNLHDFAEKGMALPLAVNLSARNLRDPRLIERITGLCTTWGSAPASMPLELTEGALMEDPENARAVLVRLHELGFELHIDDFGTGYSSLAYLQRLPVDAIKVDQSFVRKMKIDAGSRAIARSTIELAHNLGLKAIAEGVEDQATLDLLAEMGCDMAQGFFIARPMAMHDFYAWHGARANSTPPAGTHTAGA
ncbi:MAG: bifunctional diguanylate cyclase/phosphodiesterase [Burkholderiales bacterium]